MNLKYDSRGLIPTVAQDAETGHVLMVAWMNAEALAITQETGEACFWSRSREELWRKGATSGSVLRVLEILVDCDADTLLLQVDPVGEEATEVILAAKGQGNQRLVEEVADLFYHTLVLLSSRGLSLDDIESELRRRHTERQTPPVDLSAGSSPGPP